MAMSLEESRNLYAKGFRCIACSGDLWLYQEILSQRISDFREQPSPNGK